MNKKRGMYLLQHIKLLSLFSFFVNKNLFLERFSFLKSLKICTQNKIYLAYFIFNRYAIWGFIFAIWWFLKWPTVALSILLVLYLSLKLILLDIDDWQLYFNNDIRLAIPKQSKRYLTILFNILVYKFFVTDNILIYLIALKIITPISCTALLCIAITYITVSAFILSLYLVLKVGSLKLKAFYSLFSYLSAMIAMFIFGYIVIKGITYIANSIYSLILGTYVFDLYEFINKVTLSFNGFLSNNNLFILISLIVVLISVLSILFIYHSANLEMSNEHPILHLSKFIERLISFRKQDNLQQCLSLKEHKLIIDIYNYNFKQYYFTFFMDRPYTVLIALTLSFLTINLNCKNLLFFGLNTVLFMTEIGSIMGNKLIANLSFITEYNTLRQFNCNGISIRKLSNAKLNLFYNIRLIPTLIFTATVIVGHTILDSSLFLIIANIISLFLMFIFYPKDYFTRNLVCTRMDYKDYESYLTEKNILEGGVDDFSPLNWLYNTLFFSVVVLSILAFIFPNIALIFNIVCIFIFVMAPIICHIFMNRIYKNVISFIERGDYSADFSKIFKRN